MSDRVWERDRPQLRRAVGQHLLGEAVRQERFDHPDPVMEMRGHDWYTLDDGDVRCFRCDCRPWSAASRLPCGEVLL